MAAYPTGGVASSNPDSSVPVDAPATRLDETMQRAAGTTIQRHVLAHRGTSGTRRANAPLNVTGNYQHVTAVPQNGLVAFQQILSSRLINETKVDSTAAKTRVNGVAPAVNGIDLSPLSIDFTGSATIAGIGGQGSAAAQPGRGPDPFNSAQNGRAVPYTGSP